MTAYHEIADLTLGGYSFMGRPDNADDLIAEHLTFIADVDLSEPCYSFDYLRLYVRKADGAVLYATDSGCSCPSPFEDVKVSDLKETTLAGLERVVAEVTDREGWGSSYSYARVLRSVRDHEPAMREAGAK